MELAFEKLDFDSSSDVILSLIVDKDLSQALRYEIMKQYAAKYGVKTLERLKEEALLEDMTIKPKPHFVKTLAYGIALFGEKSFTAAIELVNEGIKKPFQKGNPYVYSIATAVVLLLIRDNVINRKNSLDLLSKNVLDENLPLDKKEIFIRWMLELDPNSLGKIRDSADPATLELLNYHH